MDILFPWRKQPQKQQQHPHPRTPQDPYYHGGNTTVGGGGGGNEQYHSLPHPQEHMLHLHQSRGGLRSRSSGGSGGYGGGMSSQVSEISGPSNSSHLHQPPPRDHGNVVTDAGRTRGGGGGTTRPSTRVQRQQRKQRQQLHQHQQQRITGASSEFSKLFPPTDESDRSLGSDLTEPTTRAAAAAAGGGGGGMGENNGGVGNPRRPSLQSRDTATSLPSYQASTTTTPFLPPPPPPPPECDDNDDDILLAPIIAVSPVRQLLDVINMSILPSSLRLASLTQAMEFLDHRDKNMHDAELREEGVAFVLYQKLGLALQLSRCCDVVVYELGGGGGGGSGSAGNSSSTNKWEKRRPSLGGVSVGSGSTQQSSSHPHSFDVALATQRQLELDKEIVMICSCLEMAHRANHAIAQTYDECGFEILPLLVKVLERPFQRIEQAVWMASQEKIHMPGSLERAASTAVTRDQKLAVQKATKVLAMYSLVPEAKQPMCECRGMLHCLTRIIDTHYYNRLKPGAPVIGGAVSKASDRVRRCAAAATDGDASTLSGTVGGEMSSKVTRLEIAASATSGAGLYMTEAARFNTIATLTNLAAHEANRMRMLGEPGMLDNICRVVFNERSDVPKECAALAITNLSHGDIDHVPELANNELVLETLLKLIKDDNPVTKRNAVVTIFNAACSDENTVRLAKYRDGIILEALVKLVGAENPTYRGDDEARANAAETLFNMACSSISETTDRMANHAGLLECLAVALYGEYTGLETKMYCSATLRRMAEIIHYPMIAQGALLSALVKAATWTSTDCIAEAFHSQAKVSENRVVMSRHHGLLNALSRLALALGDDNDVRKVRMAACLAIECMSREEEARVLLAQNEGIIMALTQASYRKDIGDEDMDVITTDGEFQDTADDLSMQSKMIQASLKKLLSAM